MMQSEPICPICSNGKSFCKCGRDFPLCRDQSGSAFPNFYNKTTGGIWEAIPNTGLTKRQLFAAMAMQGLIAGNIQTIPSRKTTAEQAIEFSDAILAELAKERK